MTYAIVQTGGKQYRVQSGDIIDVERLEAAVGDRVELDDVRLVAQEAGVEIGTPQVDGARVLAQVEEQFRGPKIIVFKYKAKTRYRRKMGHRQQYTRLHIQEILLPGTQEAAEGDAQEGEAVAKAPRVRRPRTASPTRRSTPRRQKKTESSESG